MYTFEEVNEDAGLEVQTAPICNDIVPLSDVKKIKISIYHNSSNSHMKPHVGEVDFYFNNTHDFAPEKHLKLRNNLSELRNIRYKLPKNYNQHGIPEWYEQGYANCEQFEESSSLTVKHCKLGKKNMRYENVLGTLLSVESDMVLGKSPVALLQVGEPSPKGFIQGINHKFTLTKTSSKNNTDIFYSVFNINRGV